MESAEQKISLWSRPAGLIDYKSGCMSQVEVEKPGSFTTLLMDPWTQLFIPLSFGGGVIFSKTINDEDFGTRKIKQEMLSALSVFFF